MDTHLRSSMAALRHIFSPANRRKFLRVFFGGIAVMVFGAVLWALKNFFLFSHRSSVFPIGEPGQYASGQIVHNPKMHFFLIRDDRGLFAMSDRCTHLGCPIERAGDLFECPCHHSRFDRHGSPVAGPAGRPLDFFYIFRDGGKTLFVDLGRNVNHEFRYTE